MDTAQGVEEMSRLEMLADLVDNINFAVNGLTDPEFVVMFIEKQLELEAEDHPPSQEIIELAHQDLEKARDAIEREIERTRNGHSTATRDTEG